MKVYSGMSGRRASSDIRACAEKGLIDADPHYNTILRYLDKPELTPLFRPVIEEAASPLAPVESRFAADGTGFHTSTYARWFDHKHGKDKKYQKWVHLHAMVGARTNVMTGVEVTEGARGESPEFVGLLKATATRFNIKEVSPARRQRRGVEAALALLPRPSKRLPRSVSSALELRVVLLGHQAEVRRRRPGEERAGAVQRGPGEGPLSQPRVPRSRDPRAGDRPEVLDAEVGIMSRKPISMADLSLVT